MRIAFFGPHSLDRPYLEKANESHGHELLFTGKSLQEKSAGLAMGLPCVSAFVSDHLDRTTLMALAQGGTRFIALRSAGHDNVDLPAARALGMRVARVPSYSPEAVAEHAAALLLTLNRKTHLAHQRVCFGNFSLEGLVGFDLYGKTVGVIGTGNIGKAFARIMRGFGCRVFLHDLAPDPSFAKEMGCEYVSMADLINLSDVVSLHIPLTPLTHHMINADILGRMKWGAILINTARGGLVDSVALTFALKSGRLGGAGLDVYEGEGAYFFRDGSNEPIMDDVLARLLSFPNVLLTGHQGFLTHEALANIAATTLENVTTFERGLPCANEI